MAVPHYYLALDNIVLKSKYTAIEFIENPDAESVSIEDDLSRKLTKVTVPDISNVSAGDLMAVCLKKEETQDEDPVEIDTGVYHLYREVSLNGFHFVLTDYSVDMMINQYVVSRPPICPDISRDKNTITIKVNSNTCVMEYMEMINNSGILYIISKDSDAYLASVYGVILNRTNNTTLRSHDIISLDSDHLLIEEADYITAVIAKLRETYPKVQFYNVDSDLNDSVYDEFVKYKASMGEFQGDLITTPVFEDPIYGSVMTLTCQIEFEYHTADLVRFSKRRFDYQINRFLSDVTTATLKFPNTEREMSFAVHWDRSSTASGGEDLTIGTGMNESNKGHYKFASTIKMVVTIYRVARDYPRIRQIILGTPIPDRTRVYDEGDKNFHDQ